MRIRNFILLSVAMVGFVTAQRDNSWAVGDSSLISFSASGPMLYSDTTSGWSTANNSSICDKNGSILFYTDGKFVYNKYHKSLLNIKYSSFYGYQNYQYSIFLPDLIDSNIVHLFFVMGTSNFMIRHAKFSIYSNSDSGAIINNIDTIYTSTFGPSFQISPGLAAVKDINNKYWWLVAQESNENRFVKFNVGNGLVNGPFIEDPVFSISYNEKALSSFSNDGQKYLFLLQNDPISYLCSMDFDRCTGLFSNFQVLDSSSLSRGFGIPCFSPNDSLIYINDVSNSFSNLLQYRVNAPDVGASKVIVGSIIKPKDFGPAYTRIATDGRLYVGVAGCDIAFPPPGTCPDTGYYAVVHNPNVYGPGCNFEDKFLMMPGVFYGDIPNMPLYTTPPLTAQQADCGYDTFSLTLGDSVLLGQPDTSLGKCTFAWFPSTGLNNASLAQPWCKPTTSGWYHLIVHDTTLSSPCAQTEDSVYVQVNAVGLEDLLEGNGVRVFPNPTTGELFFEWTEVPQDATVVLTDLVGHVLFSVHASSTGVTLDLSGMAAGVYLYHVENRNNGIKTGQVVFVREE